MPRGVGPQERVEVHAAPLAVPLSPHLRAWESKIGDPWCTQLFCGWGLTIPTSDNTFIPPWCGDNYSSAAIDNFEEIDAQVTRLLAEGKIEPVSSPSEIANLVVNPVGAADKKDRGVVLPEKRFYLDCSRHINSRLPHYKMHLPGSDDALARLYPNAWMAKVDLSAAFLHVRIDPRFRRLLGFKWRDQHYQFTRMIFGLSTAPAIWQYAMDRVCDYLRSLGLNIIVYLDDFLLISSSLASCTSELATLYDELGSLGLSVNMKKTLGPAQSLHYLGLEIDSSSMELRVPDYKLIQTRAQLSEFRTLFGPKRAAPLRAVLSLTGRLGHIARAVRASRPFLRHLWDTCRGLDFAHNLRNRTVSLSNVIWRDLDWWDSLLSHWNGVARWISDADIVSFSDASNLGFGFHCGPHVRAGAWPLHLRGRHINWKELRAIELSCAEFGHLWSGRRVLLACDNQSAVSILNHGSSRNPALAAIGRRIALLAALFDFDFRAVHIPGASNKLADFLSRSASCCPVVDWPSDYLDLLDSHPSSLLSDLPSLRRQLFSASHSLLSSSGPCACKIGEACAEHEEDLRPLRQEVPFLERLARSSRTPDQFGSFGPVLSRIPRPPRAVTLCDFFNQRRVCCNLEPLQCVHTLEVLIGLQGHYARYCAHHGGSPETEAPIPLEVVTPPRQAHPPLA